MTRRRRIVLRCPLDLAFAHLLHFHCALLLHLPLLLHGLVARALLGLHLGLALLLHPLVALLGLHFGLALLLNPLVALPGLHLGLPLLLHLLRADALLRLLLTRTLLLHMLVACALLRLLLHGAVVHRLRGALDGPHHGQAPGSRRRALRFAGRADHRRARQGRGLARVHEAGAGQLAGAQVALHGLVACRDRVHGVPERFRRTGTAVGRFGGAGCGDRACRLIV